MISFDPAVILAFSFLVLLAVVARVSLGSWLVPGAFFPFVWIIIFFLSLITYSTYEVSAGSAWWITISALAVFIGSLISKGTLPKPSSDNLNQEKTAVLPLRRISFIIIVSIVSGILYAVIRYHSWLNTPPLWAQIMLSLIYAAPILGGLIIVFKKSTRCRALSLFSFAPVILMGIMLTGRSSVLLAIVLWVSGYLVGLVYTRGGKIRLFTPRHILAGISIALFLLVMVMALQMVRLQTADLPEKPAFTDYIFSMSLHDLPLVWPLVKHAIFGHASAFSYWFANCWDYGFPKPSFGAHTFAGPCDLVGLAERPYPEDFEIEFNIHTNVYTMFYELITDFTPPGALIVLFFMAIFATRAFYGVVHHKMLYGTILAAFYAFTMYSPISSIFRYNSPILAFLIVALAIRWEKNWGRGNV